MKDLIKKAQREIAQIRSELEKDSALPWFVQENSSAGICLISYDRATDKLQYFYAVPSSTEWRIAREEEAGRGMHYGYIGVQLMQGSRATLIYKDSQPTLEEAREALRRFDGN